MNRLEFYTNLDTFKGKDPSLYIKHYGTLGQKWGQRHWQNADGTFNEAGKERYFGSSKRRHQGNKEITPKNNPNGTVFISGSSKTQFDDNPFYREELPKAIQDQIQQYMNAGKTILVGDAPGIDRQVQNYLKENNYTDVEVYSPGKETRYSANPDWKVNHVNVEGAEEGSPEWLRGKDEAMSDRATEGLAITIENGAQATRNNVDRLKSQDKDVNVFEIKENGEDGWSEQKFPHDPFYQNDDGSLTEQGKLLWSKGLAKYRDGRIDWDAKFNNDFKKSEEQNNKLYEEIKDDPKDPDRDGFDRVNYDNDQKETYYEFRKNYDKNINKIIDEIVKRETNDGMIETWNNGNKITPESFKKHLWVNSNWNGRTVNSGGIENGVIELYINEDGLFGDHSFAVSYDPVEGKIVDYEGLV